jgi:peptidyl-prolyl cis-trans isomerase B (cyclophilin B)
MEPTFIILHTNLGDIKLALDTAKAPVTAENFVNYVKSGHYNGAIFHRVIPGFMVQGGGFDAEMAEKGTKGQIKNEANNGLKNESGSIAMARTSEPHSASAQFFINLADNEFLDFTSETTRGWGYAVFGRVVDGMDVVRGIEYVPTGSHGFHKDVPTELVIIESAEIVTA